mmetsp:Transcript_16382/g.28654  ORF Transcript_16382/g.28654 Transcript_16382/m.28654 type:complete len:202 (+) Transcript_16382:776-1381(+)
MRRGCGGEQRGRGQAQPRYLPPEAGRPVSGNVCVCERQDGRHAAAGPRTAARGGGLELDALLDHRGHDVQVPGLLSDQNGGLALQVLDVVLGAVVDEGGDDLHVAGARGDVQRGPALLGLLGVDVCLVLEQEGHLLDLALARSLKQRVVQLHRQLRRILQLVQALLVVRLALALHEPVRGRERLPAVVAHEALGVPLLLHR